MKDIGQIELQNIADKVSDSIYSEQEERIGEFTFMVIVYDRSGKTNFISNGIREEDVQVLEILTKNNCQGNFDIPSEN